MAAKPERARLPDQIASRNGQAWVGARSNAWIAGRLRQAAALLTAQGANPFRIAAYRRAADALAGLDEDVRAIFDRGGHAPLDAVPGIGPTIARAIAEMLTTGQWSFLDGLKGAADPATLFRYVPGIGPELAERILATLHVDSLEALEAAAHDGRLAEVPGIGPRRAGMVRSALAELLSRLRPPPSLPTSESEAVMLLDVDREYHDKAAEGVLHRLAPKRFKPTGEAWLPVLHTVRGPWHFTALFSNTTLAHRLGRTADWVVIYFPAYRPIIDPAWAILKASRIAPSREHEARGHAEVAGGGVRGAPTAGDRLAPGRDDLRRDCGAGRADPDWSV